MPINRSIEHNFAVIKWAGISQKLKGEIIYVQAYIDPGILEQVERERDNFVQPPYFANDETDVQRGQVIEFEVDLSV